MKRLEDEMKDRVLGKESDEPIKIQSIDSTLTPNDSTIDSLITFVEYPDSIKVGERYCQIYHIRGYGRTVYAAWFARIAELNIDMDCSISLKPLPNSEVIKLIIKNLLGIETDILAAEKIGLNTIELRNKKEDLEKILSRLQKNEERTFYTSFTIKLWANTKEELNKNKELLTSTLASLNLDFEQLNFRMKPGFSHVLHSSSDIATRTLFTSALAMSTPFVTESYPQTNGVPLGLSTKSGLLITLDPFSYPAPHILAAGSSGRGKTTAIELFLSRNLYFGIQSIIIDPASEYTSFTKALGGLVINDPNNIDFNSPMITLDTFGLPDDLRDERTAQMLNAVKQQSEFDRKKRYLCIDEAHLALFHSTNSQLLRELIKTRRKFNTSIVLITQNTADFLANKQAGEQILGNTDTKILFGFQDSEMKNVTELFGLTPEEEKFLRSAAIGKALLITPQSRIPIEIIATTKELQLIKGISPNASANSPTRCKTNKDKSQSGGGK